MQKLSESELSIMMKIWKEDRPLYLEEIADLLEEFNWAISTVRNFLTRIIDKGYLKVEKDGRKNVYIALVSKEYINKKGKGIIKKLYNNSVKKFVAELYESDSIDQKDLLELKGYLDEKIKGERAGDKLIGSNNEFQFKEKEKLNYKEELSLEQENVHKLDGTEDLNVKEDLTHKDEDLNDKGEVKEGKKEKVVLKRLNNIL